MSPSDIIRVRHIIEAARDAIEFAAGRKEEELNSDRMLARSLERQIEIVGEAASKISIEMQRETPQIPWANIVGMRNRLIHAYFDINLGIVWKTVVEDLPPLLRELEIVLLSAEPRQD